MSETSGGGGIMTTMKPKRWRVIFGNYFPREVDSTFDTQEEAQRRADELNEEDDNPMWSVEAVS